MPVEIHQIAEHHRDMPALAGSCGSCRGWRWRHSGLDKRRRDGCRRRCTAQFGNRLQQLLAMAERHDADVLEIVVGQPAQQLNVDVVGAKHLGILAEADPAEPTVDVQVRSPWALISAVPEVESWRPS